MFQTVDTGKEITLNLGFAYRNVRLRPYPSLIFPVIWKKIQPTDIAQTRSSFIGKRFNTLNVKLNLKCRMQFLPMELLTSKR